MAMPALKFESESPVEARLARLEANVENIQSDITEIKADIRRLDAKIDAQDLKSTARIDDLGKKLSAKDDKLEGMIRGLEKAFADLKIGRAYDRVWWLMIAAAILGVMAHGFKWI